MENRPEANCEVQFLNSIRIVYNAEKRIIELKRNSNDHQPYKIEVRRKDPEETEIGTYALVHYYGKKLSYQTTG